MKPWLLFIGGLLMGGAGGVVMGGFGREDQSKHGGEESEARRALSSPVSGSGSAAGPNRGGSRAGRTGRGGGKRTTLRGPANGEELLEYLKTLAAVDDFEEVNFMQLLRHGSFITTMSEGEVVEFIAVLRQREEEEDDEGGEMVQVFSALLFARLAELNGPEAMRMAMAGELGAHWESDMDDLVAVGIGSWVDANPDSASEWFRGVGMSDPQFVELFDDDDVQSAFFAAMARHDTKQAMALAQEAGGEVATDTLEVIARYEESLERLEEMLAKSSGRSKMGVFEVMSNRDPQVAAEWLAEQPNLESRDDYVRTLAGVMLDADVAAGAEWYMQQEVTAEGKEDRFERVVRHMANEDLAQASTWLEAQEDTPERDGAEVQVARQLALGQDWTSGFHWAAQVGDEGQQRDIVNWMLRRGWDSRERMMNPQVSQAAEAAGFGVHLDEYIESRGKER